MKFALPDFLWLLLLTPLAGWLLWQAARQRQKLMASFVHPRLLESLTAGLSPVRRRIRYVCLLAALALLAIAIARPQWGFQWEEVKQRGLDIVVAIDTSRSMLAEDIKPNRLERAKLAALDLVQQARSDRVGLIAFAGTAFMQCPLTLDDEAFRQSVTMLDTEIIPQTGTAIAEAVQVARAAFTNENENYKVLILFTDGEDHEQGVIEAAEEAAKAGLKIFTVGVGTPEGEVLRSSDTRGRNAPLKDEEGKTIHSKLDERLLSRLATTTGGFYQRLTGAHTIETLYEKGLAPLPKVDYSARLVRQYYERFHWPLGLAILLLMVEILLPDRAMKPRNWRSPFSVSGAALWAALGISTLSANAVSVGEAQKHLDNGWNKAAKKAYEQLLIKKPDDPRLHYNLGVAAFRDKDFERAAREFGAATASPDNLDLQERAFYNAGNALYRMGEAATDLKEKKSHWQSATNQYTNALRLDAKDEDAKYNLAWVLKKLEELEQQQNQQQNQQKQDQQDQNQDQQKQDQNQQQQAQNKPDKQEQQKSEQEKQQQQQSAQTNQQQNAQANQQQSQSGQKGAQTNDQAAAQTVAAIQMTQEQAKQLLEAAKVEEKVLPFNPLTEGDPKKQNRSYKNW